MTLERCAGALAWRAEQIPAWIMPPTHHLGAGQPRGKRHAGGSSALNRDVQGGKTRRKVPRVPQCLFPPPPGATQPAAMGTRCKKQPRTEQPRWVFLLSPYSEHPNPLQFCTGDSPTRLSPHHPSGTPAVAPLSFS